jgi:hypothetical protein
MMAIDGCSDLSRPPRRSQPEGCGPISGAVGRDSWKSDRRTGEWMVAGEVAFLGAKVRGLLQEYDRLKPSHRFTSFDAVERLLAEVVVPRVPSFRSSDMHTSKVTSGSVWCKNCLSRPRGASD